MMWLKFDLISLFTDTIDYSVTERRKRAAEGQGRNRENVLKFRTSKKRKNTLNLFSLPTIP